MVYGDFDYLFLDEAQNVPVASVRHKLCGRKYIS